MKLISARSSCRAGAHQHRKARPGDLRRALEVENAQRRSEIPVRASARSRTSAAHPTCARRRCPRRSSRSGTLSCGMLGIVACRRPRCCSTASSSISSCLICCAALLVRLEDRPRVQALALGARHFVARRVLLALEAFELRDRPAGAALRASPTARARSRNRRRAIAAAVRTISMLSRTKVGSSIPSTLSYSECPHLSERPCFPPPDSAHVFFPPPRRSRKKCCRSSTSRRFNTASKKRSRRASSNLILVTGRGKNAIEDHFDVSSELEAFLERRGKTRAARGDPQDLEPDQRRLRAPGRAARPRPRRADGTRRSSATSPSPSSSATT